MSGLTLAELSSRTGVPVSTIHHYRARGLLGPAPGGPPGRRRYGEADVRALRLVRRLRERRGLSLEAIAAILPALLGSEQEAFRPAMWDRLLGARSSDDPTRAALVDAALAELAHRSLDEVTVAELCTAAGVGKGTFYRYFDGKEPLFVAAAEVAAARVDAAVGDGGEPPVLVANRLRDALAPVLAVLLELATRAARGTEPFLGAAPDVFARITGAVERALGGDDGGLAAVVGAATDLFEAMLEATEGAGAGEGH